MRHIRDKQDRLQRAIKKAPNGFAIPIQEHSHASHRHPFSLQAARRFFSLGRLAASQASMHGRFLAAGGGPMRDPPNFAVLRTAVAPRERVVAGSQTKSEQQAGSESFVQRFLRVLSRALSTWPN